MAGFFGRTHCQPTLSRSPFGEINLLTSDFSAEYAGIANVRVSTKRGGSDYHGSAFLQQQELGAGWLPGRSTTKNNFGKFFT